MDTNVKIIGYGSYIPIYRIKKEEYIKVWGHFSGDIDEKSVIGYDEDVITMAVEAGYNALKNSGINKDELKLIAIGSTSAPYTVKSIASEVAMALGAPLNISLLDFTESEKAGTTALSAGIDIIRSKGGYGLIIGSDSPLSSPGDNIEHVQSCAAAALVIGVDTDGIAKILGTKSSNIEYIQERFKKEGSNKLKDLEIAPYSNYAYTNSIKKATNSLLTELNLSFDDFDHVFIQGHNIKQATRIFRQIKKEKFYTDTLKFVGDSGAATALLGLVAIFHYKSNPNNKILLISYGSSAGSDVFCIKMDKKQEKIAEIPTIDQYLKRKQYINYEKYLKLKNLIDLD
ncbi:MAG: hypothetical protein ACTSPY_03900 [Candidatus Helarchaeota archaeon]